MRRLPRERRGFEATGRGWHVRCSAITSNRLDHPSVASPPRPPKRSDTAFLKGVLMSILTVLSAAQFDITSTATGASVDHALARIKTWKIAADNVQEDAGGLGDQYELN